MYALENFTLANMVEASSALRSLGKDSKNMSETTDKIVRYFYDNFAEKETGGKAFTLVRLFKTHPYGELDEESKKFAKRTLNAETPESPAMKCLTLLSTAGIKPEWNSRKNSVGHKAIPLPSESFSERFPMIRNMVRQFGLEINTLLKPDPKIIMDLAQKTYNTFHIPEAFGSPYVPAQKEFIIPFGVRSVIGFGGILPSGNLFVVILFCRVPVSRETADIFKTLALSIKLALLPLVGGKVFA